MIAPEAIAKALEAVRAVFEATGAELVDPPVLQPARPYVDVSGEDVRARLFFVEDPEGRALVMRPDLTIPVCRLHLDRGGDPGRSAAYRYEGKAFKYAAPGSGRAAEFIQVGLERFGDADAPAADAESLGVALEAVRRAGARVERLVLGDAGLFNAFVDGVGLGPLAAERLKRAFAAADTLEDALAADPAPSPLAAALASLSTEEAAAALDEIYALAGVEAVGARAPRAVAERLLARAAEARAAREAPNAA
ncbi:MAG: ATP phosphoribosyltransferase regulatory subunit, partial [Caulobacterales bacterium]|nr:ATP phosphoribosyltransferase regulatory subunit [Caulobacterales bacterium]